MEKIICLLGMPGSGKSVVRRYIRDKYGARAVCSGDIIREETRRRGLRKSPENDTKIALWFHDGREDLLVRRLWNKIKNTNRRIVVIDGFRSNKQLNYLKKLSKLDPILVNIKVPFKIRAKRMLKRQRWGSKQTLEYVKSRDKREIKQGVGKILKKAEYKIDNSGSITQTKKNTDRVMEDILKNL